MMSMSTGGRLGQIVSSRVADPFQLWKKNPEIVDPLGLTDAQDVLAQKEENERRSEVISAARRTQESINRRYGLQGNLTILGG